MPVARGAPAMASTAAVSPTACASTASFDGSATSAARTVSSSIGVPASSRCGDSASASGIRMLTPGKVATWRGCSVCSVSNQPA